MGTQQHTPDNMKSLVAILFVNIVLARPDHGVTHAVHHGVHHQPLHHAVHTVHQPAHHAVHTVHQPLHHVVHAVHQPLHHAVHHPVVHHQVAHHSVSHHEPMVEVKAAPPTIAELVVSDSRFSTLLAAVKAADLVETLSGEGPFTVFAPTNAAFEKVPKEALAGLLENKEELTKVLLRHVVPSAIQGKNIPPGTTNLATAGGEKIDVTRNQNNIIQIKSDAGSAYVILFDVIASNGVIHAVDTVF